jgi:membrane associated rhomboid family serine protease
MIPYSCDAPLYHLPIATGALILMNVLVFAGMAGGTIDPTDGWILKYGTGLHPAQWLLSTFTHGDAVHLLSNMFFLWSFGLVTEGKLGWWKFLACFLGIAVTQSAVEQLVMMNFDMAGAGSFGASAAIFGLMAMACFWAPVNELSVFCMLGWYVFTFDVTVGVFAAICVGIDLMYCIALGSGAGGSIMHLMGAALGAAVGATLLKTKVVDGEDWDLFAVWSGTYGSDRKKLREAAPPAPEKVAARADERALEARRRFDAYLQIDQPEHALAVRRRMIDLGQPLALDRSDLLRLITALHKRARWSDSAPVMAELLERFPDDSEAVRLKLAQICLVELEKPGRALDLLAGLDGVALPPSHERLRQKIGAAARRQVDEGELEVDDAAW